MRILAGNLFAIYRRELQGYFGSPFSYAIAGVFWLITGIFFLVILQSLLQQVANYDLQAQFGGGANLPPIDVATLFVQSFLGSVGIIVLIVMPMLSMGLYTEERKRGTLELLATSPITNWGVATGKLLAVLTFVIGMILPIMLYEAIAFSAASPPLPFTVFLAAHAGLVLLAASVLSLGMFISSLTESTVLAAILTFVLVLLLWILQGIGDTIGGPIGEGLNYLSLLRHYTTLTEGVLDLGSFVVFASYIFLGIFLTAQTIETLRFQRS
ncbi:MAG: ABC transporter permease [Cyanobacteria bacterium P01_H01_bin.121]